MLATVGLAILLVQQGSPTQLSMESPELEKILQLKVTEFSASGETFLQALLKVAAEFEIPMGIEWVRAPEASRKVHLSWRDASVYEVVESVVKSWPGYDFEISDGVVHVFPRGLLADKRSFLNLGIAAFEVEDDYVMFASRRLRNRVRRIVSPPPPPRPGAGYAGSMATGWGDRRVSFKLKKVTVRDVLDKLILSADLKVWIVTYTEKPGLTQGGFRNVLAVDGTAIAEQEQPVWGLYLWGYDPITMSFRRDWRYRDPDGKVHESAR